MSREPVLGALVDLVPRLESEMAAPVVAHFEAQGYAVSEQVHFNGRIADVLATKDSRVVAVELKLRDWRTAHRQALAYQIGSHLSYVALPLTIAQSVLRASGVRREFQTSGCGLLGVNHPYGDVRELVAAQESARALDFLREKLARGD